MTNIRFNSNSDVIRFLVEHNLDQQKVTAEAFLDAISKFGDENAKDVAEFTEDELNILETIYQRFKSENSTKISEISHNEEAWQTYVDSGQMIRFDMAFSLKAIL